MRAIPKKTDLKRAALKKAGAIKAAPRRITDTPRSSLPEIDATRGAGTGSTGTGMATYGTRTGSFQTFAPGFTPTFGPNAPIASGQGGGGIDFGGLVTNLGNALIGKYITPGSAAGGTGSEAPSGQSPVPGNFSAPGGGPCGPGSVSVLGKCVDPMAALPGGDPLVYAPQSSQYGAAVYGRYGLALQPAMRTVTRSECPAGMVLGKDGLCYESLPKKDRKWNPGAKPLLTGGEMNAINKANRAAKRLAGTQKKLKKVGKAIGKVC